MKHLHTFHDGFVVNSGQRIELKEMFQPVADMLRSRLFLM